MYHLLCKIGFYLLAAKVDLKIPKYHKFKKKIKKICEFGSILDHLYLCHELFSYDEYEGRFKFQDQCDFFSSL